MYKSLAQFPGEILANILSYVELSDIHDGLRLCGNKLLWLKIMHAPTMINMYSSKWAALSSAPSLGEYKQLTRLAIHLPYQSFVFSNQMLIALPSTMLEIEFIFPQAPWIWIRPITPDDDHITRLLFSWQGYTVMNLKDHFPKLTLLHIMSATSKSLTIATPPATIESPLHACYPHLESKIQSCGYLWNEHTAYKFFLGLPSSITCLRLPQHFEKIPPLFYRTPGLIMHWPSNIVSLLMSDWMLPYYPISALSNLRKLIFINLSDINSVEPRLHASLPHCSKLEILELSGLRITSSLMQLIPPSVTDLRFTAAIIPWEGTVQVLPTHVTSFYFETAVQSGVAEFKLHSNVRNLKILCPTADYEPDKFDKILPNLYSLHLSCSIGEVLEVNRLATSLIWLSIDVSSVLRNEHLRALPQSLTHLCLHECGSRLDDSDLLDLPRYLTTLFLIGNKRLTANCFANLPPVLKSFHLSDHTSFCDHELGLLPRNLTSFSSKQIQLTGKTLPFGLRKLDATIWLRSIEAILPPAMSNPVYLSGSNSEPNTTSAVITKAKGPKPYHCDLPESLEEIDSRGMSIEIERAAIALVYLQTPNVRVLRFTDGNTYYSLNHLEVIECTRPFSTSLHRSESLTELNLPGTIWGLYMLFPPKLRKLLIFALRETTELPQSLETLIICAPPSATYPRMLLLPPSITHDSKPLVGHVKECMLSCPPNIVHLSIPSTISDYDTFQKLPNTLTHLQCTFIDIEPHLLQGKIPQDLVEWNINELAPKILLPHIPQVKARWRLKWTPQNLSSLPSTLQSLAIIFEAVTTPKYTGYPHKLGLSLPPTLTVLDLSLTHPIGHAAPRYLPATLTELKVNAHYFGANSIQCLPRGIRILVLLGLKKFRSPAASKLPPALTALQLNCHELTDAIIPALPRNLRYLSIPYAQQLTAESLQHLPPTLREVILPSGLSSYAIIEKNHSLSVVSIIDVFELFSKQATR